MSTKRFVVIKGAEKGQAVTLPNEGTMLIGRGRACGFRLNDPHISRAHCQVESFGGQCLLTDFESASGTLVNGTPVHEDHPLQSGDVVTLGETILRFEAGDLAEAPTLKTARSGPAGVAPAPVAVPIPVAVPGRPAAAPLPVHPSAVPPPPPAIPLEDSIPMLPPMPVPPGKAVRQPPPQAIPTIAMPPAVEPPMALPVAPDSEVVGMPVAPIAKTKLPKQPRAPTPAKIVPPRPDNVRPQALPAERLHELTGQTLAHYNVGPLLAKGQSGLVFQATDLKDDRSVALKVLWPESTQDLDQVKRFIRSMRTMLPVRHENLVAIYGAGRSGAYCWIAMELVEGESLVNVIQRISAGGKADWRIALSAMMQVGRALEFAHGKSIIHRNVCPKNLLVRSQDKVIKLADLMLAKAQEGVMAQDITKPGELLGDVRFLPPERTTNAPADERSDLYSLGVTIYALLTGKAPFEGRSPVEILLKLNREEPAPPRKVEPNIPEEFERIVMKLLSKSPSGRHQSAKDLLRDLESLARQHGFTV
jgi:hypothetical protein